MTALFIVTFVLALAAISLSLIISEDRRLAVCFVVFVLFCAFACVASLFSDCEYKRGQIDYHNGIIKYELKTNPDSTVVWEYIKTK